MKLRGYRPLLLIYGIGLCVGTREFLVSRDRGPLGWLSPEWQEETEVLAEVNPNDPDTEFLKGMQALSRRDDAEFNRRIERVLAADVKHNELWLKFYADYLLSTRPGDWEAVNAALNQWRRNFPFSKGTISIFTPAGPADAREAGFYRERLAAIPWVADSQWQPISRGGARQWELRLMFRRGRVVDIRQLADALDPSAARSSGVR
jgi:hypothetical protein